MLHDLLYTGQVVGLNSQTIQTIDLLNSTESCSLTFEPGSSLAGLGGTGIEGNTFLVREQLNKPINLTESFQLSIRAIGSQRPIDSRAGNFEGTAVFFIEQYEKTVGIFSADGAI